MNLAPLRRLASLWRADFCSPKDFVQRALVISGLFLVVHLAGWREFTSILNGTMGSVESGWATSAFLGGVYVLLYLAFVLLVPTLLLAAALLWLRSRLLAKSGTRATSGASN